MLRQLIVALLAFQLYYWGVNFIGAGTLEAREPLAFNVIFSFWLAMEAYRVRLGHSEKSQTFGFVSRMFLLISFFSVALGLYDASTRGGFAGLLPVDRSFLPGVALLLGGIYLRHLSIKTLGRFFVTKVQITDGHQLVREGIYGLLRHPSYTGLIVGFLGSMLMIGSVAALALFVLIGIPAYYYRIYIEEKALVGAFGAEYIDYKANTYALIPYIY